MQLNSALNLLKAQDMCSISGRKVLLYDRAVIAMNELMNKKILIVDDEKELLKTVSDALFKEGFFNIYTAASCEEALSVAASQPVALMLLDISLPDGSGFELYAQLREYTDAPVIFLTARGSGEDRITGLRLGADDYIVKPFLMRELVLRVKALLRRTYAIAAEEQGADRAVGAELQDLRIALDAVITPSQPGEIGPETIRHAFVPPCGPDHGMAVVANLDAIPPLVGQIVGPSKLRINPTSHHATSSF